ncbi:SGNH/GDSL hydrolase family protein [Nocardioides sp. CER19]|uniref:SGNH/GDSL hydrolase family protein n=1 Tax=Nocardioides sp. CER19 TaxID=3038538 RepID=UPI002447ECAD|nr:SGNH/GDSL hydrolase family protein [Nocardioides sp. CER19]MDH2416483.1 SGNH/GDSL hydrolase family protein [Nocardioides sp. CER19]
MPARTAGRLALSFLLAALLTLTLGAPPLVDHGGAVPPAARGHAVLALGDSVPSGHACDCQPFPQTYGSLLSQRTGAPVSVDNRAVGGLDTADVIAQLRTPDVQGAVRRSDVVLLTIGANDFGDHHDQVVSGTCGGGDRDCVSDELDALRAHLTAVLATIRSLRQGRPTTMLVTGYWNVFEDGDVARRAYGTAGLRASLALTRRANAVISSVSASAGARYVDLFTIFEQPGRNVTALMAADGDHPNAAGHALIARTLLDAGLPRTS